MTAASMLPLSMTGETVPFLTKDSGELPSGSLHTHKHIGNSFHCIPPLTPQPGGLLTGMTAHSMKDAVTTLDHLTLLLISTLVVVTTTRRATRTTREWRHA